MKKLNLVLSALTLVISIGFTGSVFAEKIASCNSPSGYSNYHHAGILGKEQSGFTEDKITGGIDTLIRNNEKEYDILFTDASKTIISSKEDGGDVLLMRQGNSDVTFLVAYHGKTIELYTFYIEKDGRKRFDLIQSKGGALLQHKSTVMSGNCSFINLKAIIDPDSDSEMSNKI